MDNLEKQVTIKINADSTGFEKTLVKTHDQLVSGTAKVEDAYKSLGIKSDAAFNQMKANATAAVDFIKNKTLSSTEEITRAQAAAAAQIKTINEQQFGHQTNIINSLKANWIAASVAIASAMIVINKSWDLIKQGAEYDTQKSILDNLTRKYQTSAAAITEAMKNHRVVGSSGGGMVEIEINGLMEVLRCRIDPQLITQNDRELLEDLVVAAINQAISKGKQMHADAVRDLTGGLPLPGAFHEALAKFTGAEGEGSREREEGAEDEEEGI